MQNTNSRRKIVISFFTLIVIGIVIAGIILNLSYKKKDMTEFPGVGEDHKFVEVSSNRIATNLSKKKTGIYIVGSKDNYATKDMIEILDDLTTDKKVKIQYFDSDIESEDSKALQKYLQFQANNISDDYMVGVTPIVYVIKGGEVEAVIAETDGQPVRNRSLTDNEKMTFETKVEYLIGELVQ